MTTAVLIAMQIIYTFLAFKSNSIEVGKIFFSLSAY